MPGAYDTFVRLLRIREVLGPRYGSEDLCMLLYSLVRRERPRIIVELGTGLGVSALWMAQGVKENGSGHVFTLDDGRHFDRAFGEVVETDAIADLVTLPAVDLARYFNDLSRTCGLAEHVTLRHAALGLGPDDLVPSGARDFGGPIDILLADFAHGPDVVANILAFFLPRMSACSSVFIDSASTHLPTYLALERTIDHLNRGKIPAAFLGAATSEERDELFEIVRRSTFRLMHLIERKDRAQNSTAWIRIEPVDWMPHPIVRLH